MSEPHTIPLKPMRARGALAALAIIVLSLLALAPGASAFKVISESGAGASQTSRPNGLAVNHATSRLYVADTENNRVDVFGPAGTFQKAFGWGVATGAAKPQTCGPAATPPTVTCLRGLRGEGSGQFESPTTIAVDDSSGDVYVVDLTNQRVEKFDEEGNFLLTFGGGVDKTVPANVCTAASGHICGAGSDGFSEGEFSSSTTIFVGVGPGGVVYVIDNHRVGEKEKEKKNRLQRFGPSGAPIAPQRILLPEEELAGALAVDSTGDFYVAGEGGVETAIRKYEPDGSLIGVVTEEVFQALAVDSADNLFLATNTENGKETGGRKSIVEYDSSGSELRRFGYGLLEAGVGGLAPYESATGDIYASEREAAGAGGNRVLHIDIPEKGPLVFPAPCKTSILGNTKATLQAGVNPEGDATTYHFEYVDQHSFETEGGFSSPNTKATPESETIGADFVLHEAAAQVGLPEPLKPETKYHCRVVATNADAPAGIAGPEGTFTTLDPLEMGATWSSDVGTDTATLNATVNPLGIPTTAYFEYVDEATYEADIAGSGPGHGFDRATMAPDVGGGEQPIDLGAGENLKVATATIAGLQPGTAYRYRIVATDSLIAPKEIPGPTQVLRTYIPGAGALPDGRAHELVSPAQKNSAEVGVGPPAGGAASYISYQFIQAGATSGEAITYTSWTSFADPKSAPGTSQYLSKRTPAGWQTENIFPFGSERLLVPPFRGFSADLGFSAMVLGDPALGEGVEGFDNLYLRNNQTGALQALTTGAPKIEPERDLCLDYAGSSEDGSRAFFAASAAYAGAPEPNGGLYFSLYEWSLAHGLRPLSILPGKSTAAAPTTETAFGAKGVHCQTAEKVTRHVVSADGQRVFWTYAPVSGTTQLLARINGEETIQLDKKVAGGSGLSGSGVFQAASSDGSVALFTDDSRLTAGSGASEGAPDLYRYELPGKTLTDLTPGPSPAAVKGVIGASDDGSHVYFVAAGVLSGEEENSAKEKAEAGANNLYLWHEGQIDFIAVLSGEDSLDWESHPNVLSARLSSDGRHLAFLSVEAKRLAGYDNTVAGGEHCRLLGRIGDPLGGAPLCSQAFLYDAEAKTLVCASCNPSGARPLGPTLLPGWTNSFEGPRYLSEDGQRFFFESYDALLFADENAKRDVYEFELAGKGSCDAESPAFDPVPGGCHFLISSGQSTDETFLIDASADGRDAFFSTRSPLVGWDENENYDIYDARSGGGFPEPSEQQPPCLAEACKSPAGTPPSSSSPGTPSFQGPGNTVAKPKKDKGKKHKHKHKAKKKHARANHKQGAGR
jgi:DNA-binding beta-propeller fold protein YncE